ncbi:GAF domain-containing protein [Streptomyces sp. NPDC048603]|uniref:GAF domain-containing protein n=1 Tax=Streptomyces sp. NPDC048603 TaxID=3365577 RepID=UPI0037208FC7
MSTDGSGRLKRIMLLALSGLLGGGVFTLSIIADAESGAAKVRWTALGSIVAIAVVAVAAYENHRAESARRKTHELAVDSLSELANAYQQALRPLTLELKGLAAEYAQENPPTAPPATGLQTAHRALILQHALDGAATLTAPYTPGPPRLPRARSAFYRWDGTGQVFRLQGIAHGARTATIRRDIPWQGDACGAKLLAVLQMDQPYWREKDTTRDDVELDAPGPGNASYQGVIVAPVRSGTVLYGVLTVDAPECGDFIEAHRELMATLGHVVAASLVLDGP